MNRIEKPRKFMLYAIGLLFLSQFFKYNADIFNPALYSYYSNRYYGGYYYEGGSGWSYHGWLGGIIIVALAAFFYFQKPKLLYYWIALPLIIILGFGGSTGGTMGFVSMLLAGYAVWLKRKEGVVVTNSNQTFNSNSTNDQG